MSDGEQSSSRNEGRGFQKENLFANRYRKITRLGKGGMGEVHLVEDTALSNLRLALKVIHVSSSTSELHRKRFLREILVTRQVSHLNIVRTYDAGVADNGDLYLTMEYLDGCSLREILESRSVGIEEGVQLLIQICHGMAAIHQAGIVHRDLKPSNILISREQVVKIADFGIARIEESDITGCEEVVGSSPYIAPEVWTGADIAQTADIYSVGVLAYELFVGKAPFEGKTPAETMWKHLNTAPLSLQQKRRDMPPWLELIIFSLLKKDHLKRPCDAEEIATQLEAGLQGKLKHLLPSGNNFQGMTCSSEHTPCPLFRDWTEEELDSVFLDKISQELPNGALLNDPLSQELRTPEDRTGYMQTERLREASAILLRTLEYSLLSALIFVCTYFVAGEALSRFLGHIWVITLQDLNLISWLSIGLAIAGSSAAAIWPTYLLSRHHSRRHPFLFQLAMLYLGILSCISLFAYFWLMLDGSGNITASLPNRLFHTHASAGVVALESFVSTVFFIPQSPQYHLLTQEGVLSYQPFTYASPSTVLLTLFGCFLVSTILCVLTAKKFVFSHLPEHSFKPILVWAFLCIVFTAEHLLIWAGESFGLISRDVLLLQFGLLRIQGSILAISLAGINWLLFFSLFAYADQLRRKRPFFAGGGASLPNDQKISTWDPSL